MKRDMSAKLIGIDGVPIIPPVSMEQLASIIQYAMENANETLKDELGKMLIVASGKAMTLGSVAIGALLAAYDDDKTITDDERLLRMSLARKVHKATTEGDGFLDLTIDDAAIIKRLVKKRYLGVVVPVLTTELLEKEPELRAVNEA